MKRRKFEKFEYTLDDLACEYCLHYQGKRKPCPLETCCCEEERREAIERMQPAGDQPPEFPYISPNR